MPALYAFGTGVFAEINRRTRAAAEKQSEQEKFDREQAGRLAVIDIQEAGKDDRLEKTLAGALDVVNAKEVVDLNLRRRVKQDLAKETWASFRGGIANWDDLSRENQTKIEVQFLTLDPTSQKNWAVASVKGLLSPAGTSERSYFPTIKMNTAQSGDQHILIKQIAGALNLGEFMQLDNSGNIVGINLAGMGVQQRKNYIKFLRLGSKYLDRGVTGLSAFLKASEEFYTTPPPLAGGGSGTFGSGGDETGVPDPKSSGGGGTGVPDPKRVIKDNAGILETIGKKLFDYSGIPGVRGFVPSGRELLRGESLKDRETDKPVNVIHMDLLVDIAKDIPTKDILAWLAEQELTPQQAAAFAKRYRALIGQ